MHIKIYTVECAICKTDVCTNGHRWTVGAPSDSPYCLRCGVWRHPGLEAIRDMERAHLEELHAAACTQNGAEHAS